MGQNDYFPNFDEWRKHGVMTRGGLVFAPHDFFVTYGRNKTRVYFSWDEAMGFEEKVLRPEGWRLPTAEEWRNLIAERVISPTGSKLNLGLCGYITDIKMDEYRRLLSPSGIVFVSGIGQKGYYWTSDEERHDSAFALGFGGTMIPSDLPSVDSFMKGFGRCIRCVAID